MNYNNACKINGTSVRLRNRGLTNKNYFDIVADEKIRLCDSYSRHGSCGVVSVRKRETV